MHSTRRPDRFSTWFLIALIVPTLAMGCVDDDPREAAADGDADADADADADCPQLPEVDCDSQPPECPDGTYAQAYGTRSCWTGECVPCDVSQQCPEQLPAVQCDSLPPQCPDGTHAGATPDASCWSDDCLPCS
jgi:hypothetical protein